MIWTINCPMTQNNHKKNKISRFYFNNYINKFYHLNLGAGNVNIFTQPVLEKIAVSLVQASESARTLL